MKFGLFYEHQLPKPYDADDWAPDQEQPGVAQRSASPTPRP